MPRPPQLRADLLPQKAAPRATDERQPHSPAASFGEPRTSVPDTPRCSESRIHVAAGILRNASGRVLLAERRHDRLFAGFWEFPGGKVEPEETAAAALRRELAEELGVEISAFEHFQALEHDYPDRLVRLDFFLVSKWRQPARPLDGQKLLWIRPAEIDRNRMLPANVPIIDALL